MAARTPAQKAAATRKRNQRAKEQAARERARKAARTRAANNKKTPSRRRRKTSPKGFLSDLGLSNPASKAAMNAIISSGVGVVGYRFANDRLFSNVRDGGKRLAIHLGVSWFIQTQMGMRDFGLGYAAAAVSDYLEETNMLSEKGADLYTNSEYLKTLPKTMADGYLNLSDQPLNLSAGAMGTNLLSESYVANQMYY